MATNSMEVVMSAKTADLISGLREVSSQMQEFSRAANSAMREAGSAAGPAARGVETLYDRMRDLKGEAVQHERVFNFFGRELASVAGISKETGAALAGILGGLGGGGALLVIVEGAKLIAQYLGRASEEAKRFGDEMVREMERADDAIFRLKAELAGLNPDRAKMQGQIEGIDSYLARLDRLKEALKPLQEAFYSGNATKEQLQDRWELIKQIDEMEKKAPAMRDLRSLLSQEIGLGQAKDDKTERERSEKEAAALEEQVTKASLDKVGKLVADEAALEKSINDNSALSQVEKWRLIAVAKETLDREITDFYAKQLEERNRLTERSAEMDLRAQRAGAEAEKKYLDELQKQYREEEEARERGANLIAAGYDLKKASALDRTDKEFEEGRKGIRDLGPEGFGGGDEGMARMTAALDTLDAAWSKARADIITGAKEINKEWDKTAEGIGNSFGKAMAGIITHHLSMKQAVAGVASEIVKTFSEMAIKAVTSNAAVAASGAASAEASVPIVGPALAAGAMAAMEGLVLGLLSTIARAEGGPVWPGQPFLVGERGPEVVQFASPGTVYPNGQMPPTGATATGSQGYGGGDVHHHWHLDGGVLDGDHFMQVVRRNEGVLGRHLASMDRRGKI